jgi:hypothetical protein
LFHSYSLFMCSSASGCALRDSSVIADYPHFRSWMHKPAGCTNQRGSSLGLSRI